MPVAVLHWQQKHTQTRKRHWIYLLGAFLFTLCRGSWWWLHALSRVEVIAKEGHRWFLPQVDSAALSSLGQNFLLLRSRKYLLDKSHWRNWQPEGRCCSAPGLPGSSAALCWVLSRLSHAGHKPRQNLGYLQSGDWLRQIVPPCAAGDCTKRVRGGHLGILTPYVCLINASGPESCFASRPAPIRGAQRKYFKRRYCHVRSSSIQSLGNIRI